MSEALINSILYDAEKRIEFHTGKKVTVTCSELPPMLHTHCGVVFNDCCKLIGIDKALLIQPNRSSEIVVIRQAIVFFIKTYVHGASFVQIGKLLKQHHTSIMHSYKEAGDRLHTNNKDFLYIYQQLTPLLK